MKAFLIQFQLVLTLTLAFLSGNAFSQIVNMNPDPNGDAWYAGGVPDLTPEIVERMNSIPELVLNPNASQITLPDSIDNSKNIYMRPIFNQYGGSCAQAAGVAYTYTYEVNYLRNLRADSSIYEPNWYPTHYTWNFLNGGDGGGSNYFDGWDIIMQYGCPNVPTWGGMAGSSVRWMSGYDEHLSAMENKIESYYSIDITSHTGLETLKHWLYNHNDSNQSVGGLGCFSIAMGGIEYDTLQAGYPNAGRSIIKDWNYSTSLMHAMTFVGYNDSVRFDINDDGIYSNTMDTNSDGIVDMQDWEIGALIVANSWGETYPNERDKGFVYFPYRLLAKQIEHPNYPDSIVYPLYNKQVHVLNAKEENVPEIALKLNIGHSWRGFIEFFVGYAENADETNYLVRDSVHSYNRNGGQHYIHGIDTLPIDIAIDYGHYYSNDDFGKVFFEVVDANYCTFDTTHGFVHSFSLVDYRWNDTLEIVCDDIDVPIIFRDTIKLSINYDLIPHEDPIQSPLVLFSDMVSRFEPIIMDDLTIEDITIDMYESTIHLREGSYLEIEDNATIHAKKGDCKIIIEGDVDFGENIKFIADKDATLEIEINNTDVDYTINNCEFQNCKLTTITKGATITNSTFDNSYVWCSSDENDTPATIKYNTFDNGEDDIAIKLTLFNNYYIEENEIDTYKYGIEINNSGRGKPGNQQVNKNEIRNCIDEGLSIFKSISYISENLISSCGKGIRLDNNSTTAIFGNPNTSYIEEMNRVYNCDSYEIYITKNSFPWYFHYNVISDYNNGGNSVGDPLLYFDTSEEDSIYVKNAEYNCWGDGFSPSADLYPDSLIDHLPMYCPPASPQDSNVVESQYKSSLDQFEAGAYAQSKAGFMFIVDQYPGTKYAQSAMRELLTLEEYADNDYAALKTYYQTNTTIQSDAILTALASKLANECDIILENYSAAVSYYEGVIQDPADTQDSIYAIIDLGFLYQTMDTTSKAFYTGKMPQYKPKSAKQFNKDKHRLLSMLPVTKEAQTGTRDYRLETYRDFTIRPNPVNNIAMLCFTLIEDGVVCFEIHNAEGVLLESLSKGYHQTGQHEIQYNASKLKPGLYYCSLVVNGEVMKTRKMVVVR